jgi:hypothetical protein
MWVRRALQRAEPGAYFIQDQIKGEPWAVLLAAGFCGCPKSSKNAEGQGWHEAIHILETLILKQKLMLLVFNQAFHDFL